VWNASGVDVPFCRGQERAQAVGKGSGTVGVMAATMNGD
jgi:hypothetical protein